MPQIVNGAWNDESHHRPMRARLGHPAKAPPAPATHCRDINEPGHAHELTFSCYRRLPLLSRDRTRQWLVNAIDAARQSLDYDVWAYVIMPEHVHLIIHSRRRDYDVAEFRKAVKEPVARQAIAFLDAHASHWLERLTRTRGTRTERLFWQSGGGYDRNITEPATLLKMIDYVHLNPVRRGLVEQARDWRWSSAAWFEGVGESPLTPDPIPPEWLI